MIEFAKAIRIIALIPVVFVAACIVMLFGVTLLSSIVMAIV